MSIPPSKYNYHRILLFIACGFALVLGTMAFYAPPGVDPDSCWGFLVMHSMELGNQFNLLPSPNPHDITKTHFEFLAWWSPGQYMVPWFFKSLLGVNIGRASALTVLVSSLVGLSGFYTLFKRLGFSQWLAAVSVLFISTQPFFISPYLYYRGGDVLMFAFSGWFIYGCFSFVKIDWRLFLFIFIGGLAGFFLKTAFMWMYAAGLACIWINISQSQAAFQFNVKASLVWLKNGLLLAIPFIAATIIIYSCYLLKGDTPAANTSTALLVPETFTYQMASFILSAFSVDDVTGGLLYYTDVPMFTYHWAIALILITAAAGLVYLFFMVRLSPDKKYPIAVCSFYCAAFLFFGYMFLKQATVSYEERHFRQLGLLFIPGFIYLCFKTKVSKVLFFAFWLLFLIFDVHYISKNYSAILNGPKGQTGFSEQVYDQEVLDKLIGLDKQHKNDAIFVVPGSDMAMELPHNRVQIIDEETPEVVLKGLKYHGKAGTLYILLSNSDQTNGRENYILKSFVNYHHFTKERLTENFLLVTAVD